MILIKNIKIDKIQSESINVYCGRGNYPGMYNAKLGNPFPNSNRSKSLKDFEEFLRSKDSDYYKDRILFLAKKLKQVKNKDICLYCWCHPKKCHCDFIKIILENYLENLT